MKKKFQLVVQFLLADIDPERFEFILQFENELEGWLGTSADVDGNDFGMGEMNIFVHTDVPEDTFERVQMLLTGKPELQKYRAGYRPFGEEKYVSLWPPGSEHFDVA